MFETIAEKVLTVRDAFLAAPLLFSALMAGGLLLVWLKWWVIGKSTRHAARNRMAGWRMQAQARAERHETGIGTRDVLVMRPIRFLPIGIMGTLFFGACTGVLVPPLLTDPGKTWWDWVIAASSCAFVAIGLFLILASFTRITFDRESVTRTRLLGPAFTARLSDLQQITPVSKTIAGGVFLHFPNGRLRVMAQMSGYLQLLDLLGEHDPAFGARVRLFARMMENEA